MADVALLPAALEPAYRKTSVSFLVFLRLRN
jgi:hypothetical protein